MKTLLRKIDWLAMCETGWGNGYVIIPKGHELHGKHYDDINVDVHGGLTYSDKLTEDIASMFFPKDDLKDDIGGWLVGFDCAHYGDTLETCPKEYVESETEKLREQLENY